MLKLKTIEKIKAIADDERATPGIREVARQMLASYYVNEAEKYKSKIHPGLRTSTEYDRFKKATLGKE